MLCESWQRTDAFSDPINTTRVISVDIPRVLSATASKHAAASL